MARAVEFESRCPPRRRTLAGARAGKLGPEGLGRIGPRAGRQEAPESSIVVCFSRNSGSLRWLAPLAERRAALAEPFKARLLAPLVWKSAIPTSIVPSSVLAPGSLSLKSPSDRNPFTVVLDAPLRSSPSSAGSEISAFNGSDQAIVPAGFQADLQRLALLDDPDVLDEVVIGGGRDLEPIPLDDLGPERRPDLHRVEIGDVPDLRGRIARADDRPGRGPPIWIMPMLPTRSR